ncbi:hypothetical protein CSW98_04705 [Vibrio sp. HA2012]|uniref:helix-turn-helix domain-containing protein n=1 Tax=Vibrio sp. HA2012 TaxID=1971595 RepID=UPI000C2BA873|nr:helix-turn-helix domain-containing protein [Vibrio sp. HA2012]PJC87206.1 hypothetical protein CSW98_04705 [Vibrio sp. HA2012]
MNKSHNKSVSGNLAKRLIANLLDLGYAWNDITEKTGIYPEELNGDGQRIDADRHYKLLRLLNEHDCDLEWFLNQSNFQISLLFDRDNILESLANDSTYLALLCLNSRSLRESFQYYIKYRGVIANTDNLSIREDNNQVSIAYFYEYPEVSYQFVPMINFIFIISFIEHYTTPKLPYHIKTKSKKTNTISTIYSYWNCEVEWESDIDSISFENTGMDEEFTQYNSVVQKFLLFKVNSEYNSIFQENSVKKMVEDSVREIIRDSSVDYKSSFVATRVCQRLNASKTTLSRRLKDEGTSFKAVEQKVKLNESINLLKNTNTSIGDIAFSLGFSTQSAFNRFFSDAMHTTPLKFRRH